MDRPKTPLEEMGDSEFENFKRQYLDYSHCEFEPLTEEALKQIRDVSGVGKSSMGHISCDEAHGHGYECIYFHNPITGLVDRLLDEIENYRSVLRIIAEKIKKKSS